MKSLKEYILEAREKRIAIGHFNISNIEGFWAVVMASRELDVPVIIGVSEGERDFIGVNEVVALVNTYREHSGQPVFLNADHTYSFERVKEAVDVGFDSVIYDGTELNFEQNVIATKKSIEYAKQKNPNIIFEAEIGFIGKSSKILDSIPDEVKISDEFLTTSIHASDFVKSTGIDMLAPAVGNIHGMLKGGKDPALNIKRIKEIYEAIKIPLVLHGASGNSDNDVLGAIDVGVAVVHVNTELRVAYRTGLMKSIQENPDEIAPYKYLKGARMAMQKVVSEKLKVFNKLSQ